MQRKLTVICIWFASDTSLDPIREDARYKALVANAEQRLAASSA